MERYLEGDELGADEFAALCGREFSMSCSFPHGMLRDVEQGNSTDAGPDSRCMSIARRDALCGRPEKARPAKSSRAYLRMSLSAHMYLRLWRIRTPAASPCSASSPASFRRIRISSMPAETSKSGSGSSWRSRASIRSSWNLLRRATSWQWQN